MAEQTYRVTLAQLAELAEYVADAPAVALLENWLKQMGFAPEPDPAASAVKSARRFVENLRHVRPTRAVEAWGDALQRPTAEDHVRWLILARHKREFDTNVDAWLAEVERLLATPPAPAQDAEAR